MLLDHNKNHRQYVIKWAWLCFNIALFKIIKRKKVAGLIWTTGYSVLTTGLDKWFSTGGNSALRGALGNVPTHVWLSQLGAMASFVWHLGCRE